MDLSEEEKKAIEYLKYMVKNIYFNKIAYGYETIELPKIDYEQFQKYQKKKGRLKIMNEKANYTDVNKEQKNRINDVRKMFSDVYDFIESNCKSSRETSLALTKLEEAQFWTIKGITRENVLK